MCKHCVMCGLEARSQWPVSSSNTPCPSFYIYLLIYSCSYIHSHVAFRGQLSELLSASMGARDQVQVIRLEPCCNPCPNLLL